jgi:hypothetical protein
MASRQSNVLIPFNAFIARRLPKLGIELATSREFVEKAQLEAGKPEGGVADAVPILWYIPQGRHPRRPPAEPCRGYGRLQYSSAETRSPISLRRWDVAPFSLEFRVSQKKIQRNPTSRQ